MMTTDKIKVSKIWIDCRESFYLSSQKKFAAQLNFDQFLSAVPYIFQSQRLI